jgi:ergothioneine biosynthesis protein EgtB
VDEARARLRDTFVAVRSRTLALIEPLEVEDLVVQSMPDASPARWHLAHTTWFFESFVLFPFAPGFSPFDPAFGLLFNSYYHALGERWRRPDRGLLSRPTVRRVLEYRRATDERVEALIADARDEDWPRLAERITLGLEHEEQHQELLLMDVKHLLGLNPLGPAYRPECTRPPRAAPPVQLAPLRWIEGPVGAVQIGAAGEAFAFDNEGPRHTTWLQPYALAHRLVSVGEYLAFVEDGGYRRPELWLSDGWATVEREGWEAPLYWRREQGRWSVFSLDGWGPLDATEPVAHVSYFEADAYARWAEARLPTEAEWEALAAGAPVRGNLLESGALHPRPASAEAGGLAQLFGDVWEHTRSAYSPYPGYRPPPGALGEYNGKFMSGQQVLRGGSALTPAAHVRASYRNFFHPHQRWAMQGLRLARDA